MNGPQRRIIAALRWRVAEARQRSRERYRERQKIKAEIVAAQPQPPLPLPLAQPPEPPPRPKIRPRPKPPPPVLPPAPALNLPRPDGRNHITIEDRPFIQEDGDTIRCPRCMVGFRLIVNRSKLLQRAVNHVCLLLR